MAGRVFTFLSLLMLAFSLDDAPAYLAIHLHGRHQCSPTIQPLKEADPRLRFFALAPLNRRRRVVKLVSCYAFFKGWLLLSQPPSCPNNSTSLPTKQKLGTLSDGLGCFPLVPRDCPAVLTPDHWYTRIRSLVRVGTVARPSPFQYLYLACQLDQGYT